ncbi:MAG: hypothetical protein FD170_1686 [Bacteroidetes bacterium]|nr:MAG: hypothetical protein FD170_1686 [Bacteroidota bacterium]
MWMKHKILVEMPGFFNSHFFAWQQSCSAFSVSKSDVDKVCTYILNQAEHHKIHTFEEEFQAYMNEYHQFSIPRHPYDPHK